MKTEPKETMTSETIKRLKWVLKHGATNTQACRFAGISRAFFYEYENKHPNFIKKKRKAKSTKAQKDLDFFIALQRIEDQKLIDEIRDEELLQRSLADSIESQKLIDKIKEEWGL